LLKTITNSTRQ